MSTIVPNLVTIPQAAAELLRFVEKNSKWRHPPFLSLYLAVLNHSRSLLMDLKRHSKFGVDRPSTFQDIAILKFWKFVLKRLFRPQNLRFWGF